MAKSKKRQKGARRGGPQREATRPKGRDAAPPPGRHTTGKPALVITKDRYVYLALIVMSVLTRLPFLRSFDLVTFDGTSYVNQAKALLEGAARGGAFPVGYPLLTAVFIPVIGDGVRAAQVVSFLASIGTPIIMYLLAKRFIPKDKAFLCALVIALNPLLIRLSLMTFSESLYVFWVCLALLLYAAGKDLGFGAAMGLASITRPESLAIFGVLMLLRIRRPRRLWIAAVVFIALFAVNSAYLTRATGRTVILPKSEFFGTSAEKWQLRETSVEFEGKEQTFEKLRDEGEAQRPPSNYVRRLPHELLVLHRYVLPVLLLLALFGMVKRPGFAMAALVPFFFIPAFTVRSEARYLLPYIPVLILYGFIGAECIGRRVVRQGAYGLILVSVLANVFINRQQMKEPVNPEYIGSKLAGLQFRDRVSPTDKIADRKPFFAFYAGGRYVEIPIAPYEDVMEFLVKEDVKLLSLHKTTHYYRPALRPLLYDRPAINGELRFTQVYYDEGGVLIYGRTDADEALTWRKLTDLDATTQSPCWSPDGSRIAFRVTRPDGASFIYIAEADGTNARSIVPVMAGDDPLAWSPNGKQLVFADAASGNWDIYRVDIETSRKTRVTSDPSADLSPTWSPDGTEIAFQSDRAGQNGIWAARLGTGRATAITDDGNNRYPVFSHTGTRLAWLHGPNAVVLDRTTGERTTAIRGNIQYRVTWSPDDRYLATESDAWGSVGIYLAAADGSNALLMTKTMRPTGMPSWDPSGDRIAVASNQDGTFGVWVLSGVDAYVKRLQNPVEIKTFEPPAEP